MGEKQWPDSALLMHPRPPSASHVGKNSTPTVSLLRRMEKMLPFSSASPSWPWAPSRRDSLPAKEEGKEKEDEEEAVIRGLSSDRLFFDAGGTRSLLAEASGDSKGGEAAPVFDGGVAVSVESINPLGDFLASMEEMVEAHGAARDWAWMQEMLGWFLRANGKGNHGYIISAFLDLVVGLASSSSSSSSPSRSCPPSTSSSSSSSSCSSCSCGMEEIRSKEQGGENG